ncbi:hypothetical protein PENCOP_c001G00925 [Penicillium coprophilum]|uniref:Uncharacterized protein n=1 Tax=Penicillium coprophilum TaxID=36646 RepID=A0A1V6V719_9EURO|nr:hypothetical protein PENCOP_c001G00925 [Penicillium coprophilum]
MNEVTAWVIESYRTRSIDKLEESPDLEADVALFITSFIPSNQSATDISQLESAIYGIPVPPRQNLLYARQFAYADVNDTTKYLQSVIADYYVVGWHSDREKDLTMPTPVNGRPQNRGTWLDGLRVEIPRGLPEKDGAPIDD